MTWQVDFEVVSSVAFKTVIAILGPWIAWNRYNFQKRKEKWLALQSLLSRRLEINKQIISNDDYLTAHEQLVTGEENVNLENAKKRFIAFYYLNQMLYIYRAKEDDLMDEDIAEYEIDAILYLLLPSKLLLKKLLDNRGYTENFRKYIKGRLENGSAKQVMIFALSCLIQRGLYRLASLLLQNYLENQVESQPRLIN